MLLLLLLLLLPLSHAVGIILGPAVAFIGSGLLLSMWVDLGDAPNGLTDTDTAWVGAWWLSFLGCGGISLLLAFIGLRYPRHFPGTDHVRVELAKGGDPVVDTCGVMVEDTVGYVHVVTTHCATPMHAQVRSSAARSLQGYLG